MPNRHLDRMTKFSLLDLIPVKEGSDVPTALADAADMARHAEQLGYTRYWVAEHHGMEGIAGAATSLVISHLAAATQDIRIGSGGIMLPNHSPLVIAEQFGTLDALYPGRIDLGLGRAPGGDQRIMQALRRPQRDEEQGFVQDILALQSMFANDGQMGLNATPGAGADISFYILGSSLYGAQVAAALGLPYAFASHFAPQMLDKALEIYRDNFKPSDTLDTPYVMAAMNVVGADSDEDAEFLASSQQQSFVRLRTGKPGKMPPPIQGFKDSLSPQAAAMLDGVLECSAVGAPDTVAAGIAKFVERTGADEIIVSGSVYDHAARKRSAEIAAEAFGRLNAAATGKEPEMTSAV